MDALLLGQNVISLSEASDPCKKFQENTKSHRSNQRAHSFFFNAE